MGILFNSTALGIHFCETSLIFNFKTRLGGEICLCDVNMHKGYCGQPFVSHAIQFRGVEKGEIANGHNENNNNN